MDSLFKPKNHEKCSNLKEVRNEPFWTSFVDKLKLAGLASFFLYKGLSRFEVLFWIVGIFDKDVRSKAFDRRAVAIQFIGQF